MDGRAKPPPEPGSGKFGTPCERMQSDYLMPVAEALDEAVLLDFDDPQAAIAIAPTIAASMISILWPFG